MKEVDRACFNCKYLSDEDLHILAESRGIGRVFGGSGGHTELEVTDDPCEVCGQSPSLKKP